MKRASPADLRIALTLATEMANVGIDFVPVPVLSDKDKLILTALMDENLEKMQQIIADKGEE